MLRSRSDNHLPDNRAILQERLGTADLLKPEDLMDDRGEAALAEHVQQRLEVVPAPAVAAAAIQFAHPDIGLELGDVITTRCAAGDNAAAGAGGADGPSPCGGFGGVRHHVRDL